MSVLRAFKATDLFRFNNINLDHWTETYSISFYLSYLSRWPDLCYVQEAPNGRLMGYVLGKVEGAGQELHGHVTAITVSPQYRRLGLARGMMHLIEQISDEVYEALFVDLFVRCKNSIARDMYEGMGYSVWRRIIGYYGTGSGGGKDDEDAFDMRKPLSRDVFRRSVRVNGESVHISAHSING